MRQYNAAVTASQNVRVESCALGYRAMSTVATEQAPANPNPKASPSAHPSVRECHLRFAAGAVWSYGRSSQTEMCFGLSLVNGERSQSAQRSRNVIPPM